MAVQELNRLDVQLPLDDPKAVRLPTPYVGQHGAKNLCWAACCEMVFRTFGNAALTMCRLATNFSVPKTDCCPDPDCEACDKPNWPDKTYLTNGFSKMKRIEGPLTLGNVLFEINAGRPLNAVLQWLGPNNEDLGKHLIVIAGYYPNGDVLVCDPENGEGRLSLDYVATAYNLGIWCTSYYNLAPANAAAQ